MVIKRHNSYQPPVKSKEEMIFHVGFRRFKAKPIYSQHTIGEKHKVTSYKKIYDLSCVCFYAL